MTLQNLYHVTTTLKVLLETNLPVVLGDDLEPDVTTQPPEKLLDSALTVNLFLYHIAEDPNYKNQTIPGAGPRGVARTPMALVLYYIVTAYHKVNEEFDAELEQQLMGATLKTFHDYPMIDAHTAVLGTRLMPETMAESGDNRLEIALRPLTPEDALHFWASEQSQTTRLSAYYEVRTVFLTPEQPTAYHGTVLSVGAYVAPMNTPVLSRSSSSVRFSSPASMGAGTRTATASPARVFLLSPADQGANPAARLTLEGSSLLAGTSRFVVLRHPNFMQLDPPTRDIRVDPASNGVHGWDVQFGSKNVQIQFGSALTFLDDRGNVRTISLDPGGYLIGIEAQVGAYQAGASTRPMLERSNFLPITVGAFIANVSQPDAASADPVERRRFELSLSPAFDVARDNADPIERMDIRLAVDGIAYERVEGEADLAENGQFYVTSTASAAPGPGGVTLYDSVLVVLRAAFDPDVPGEHALRFVIEGVDANPFWIEVT